LHLSDSASKLFVSYLDQKTVLDQPRVASDDSPLHFVGEPCLPAIVRRSRCVDTGNLRM
jgi:hypothetical protein